jgi:hypothetical protein
MFLDTYFKTLLFYLFPKNVKGKGKGRTIPVESYYYTGPEGSRTLRVPDF